MGLSFPYHMTLNSPITVLLPRTPVMSSLGPLPLLHFILKVVGFGPVRGVCFTSLLLACGCPPSSVLPLVWVSVLYVGCVSRPICGRVCVPRPLCYLLYGFRCCTWGVCRVPSVGVCVSPVHCVSLSVALVGTRGVFRVTIVGVWVSPVYCSLSTWSQSPPGVDTYFLISLRSICYHRTTVSS